MLHNNMTMAQIRKSQEWDAFCQGYSWLMSVRNIGGGWSRPGWRARYADAATIGHVLRVLLEIHPAAKWLIDELATLLQEQKQAKLVNGCLEWHQPSNEILAAPEVSFDGSLCAIWSLLDYSRLSDANLNSTTASHIRSSGEKWVLRCLEGKDKEKALKYGLWWLSASASILARVNGSHALWDKIRAECDSRLSEDGTHWVRGPGGEEQFGYTINVLECLMQFPEPDLRMITTGVRYLLQKAESDGKGGAFWPCEYKGERGGKEFTGPLLVTRPAVWFLSVIRQAGIQGLDLTEVEDKVYGGADWLARHQRPDGCWKEAKDMDPLPSAIGNALLALFRSLKLACAPDHQEEMRAALNGILEVRLLTIGSHAFMNHVIENSEIVKRLSNGLETRGVNTWTFQEELRTGDVWKRRIKQAIQRGRFVIVCLSPQYLKKRGSFAHIELGLAMNLFHQYPPERRRLLLVKLYPCEVAGADLGDLPVNLEEYQWIAIYKDDWDAGIDELVEHMRHAIAGHQP